MIHYIDVPHFSQFNDIPAVVQGLAPKNWQKEGCGIAAMAMLIEFSKPETDTSVPKLLTQAIQAGAYVPNVGWSHTDLAGIASRYGLTGTVHNFTEFSREGALARLKEILKGGPVIASVYNKFIYGNPLGHLIVVTGFDENFIYYNDPALRTDTESKISIAAFLTGWKKRVIAVRNPEALVNEVLPSAVTYNIPDSPLVASNIVI